MEPKKMFRSIIGKIQGDKKRPTSRAYDYHPDDCPHDWPDWGDWCIQLEGFQSVSRENKLAGTRERRCPLCGGYETDYSMLGELEVEIIDGEPQLTDFKQE
jgi:hypothetical protein